MRFDISALINPKARPLLGLDISSSAVKLVELTANGKEGYRVERYTIEVLPKDAVSDGNIANMDGVVDAVKRAWKRLGTSTRNVAMALPSSAVITSSASGVKRRPRRSAASLADFGSCALAETASNRSTARLAARRIIGA